MHLEITTPVLTYISKVINRGQPRLAQAIANEYLPKDSGLRKAIAMKVIENMEDESDSILELLCKEGKKISEIEKEIFFEKPVQSVISKPLVAVRKSWKSRNVAARDTGRCEKNVGDFR